MPKAIKKIFFSFKNHLLVKILSIAGLLIFSRLNAQEENSLQTQKITDTSVIKKATPAGKSQVDQKDISDVISSLFKKPPTIHKSLDTITTKPIYSFIPAVGYTLQTKLAAVISGNVAFHISPGTKLSTISASATYTQNKQFYIPVQSNISTKDNRVKLIGDLRFYKYPQSTFGLGSCAPIQNEDPMDYDYFRFYETAFRKIKGNFFVGAGYNLDYHWKISHKGNKNGTPSDYAKYGMSKQTTSSGITLNALYDSRNNPINARKGSYASLQFRNNFKAIGSHSNWRSVIVDIRKYFPFPGRSQNVLAFWSYNTFIINGKAPYLDLPSTGWDSYNATGRGFIQGRYRGTKMVYLESEYRFRITSNGLFGGVVYVNEESFSSVHKSRLETFQPGFGTGLRIKLNKLSNTNLSIDYGFGTQGSKGL
ncbi:MAG: hypothetical protein JWQ09_4968, partial [Segetibacter sp.]|nr:hypothetical protein [Segetibacter sp.]